MPASTAAAFQDLGPLVLGDHALDLEQEIVLGAGADGAVHEDDLGAGPPELLDEEDLIGVAPGQTVRCKDKDLIEHAGGHGIPQPFQSWPQERGAAVAFVDELIAGICRQASAGDPLAQRRKLAGHGVAAGLLLARHPRIKRNPGLRHDHSSA